MKHTYFYHASGSHENSVLPSPFRTLYAYITSISIIEL